MFRVSRGEEVTEDDTEGAEEETEGTEEDAEGTEDAGSTRRHRDTEIFCTNPFSVSLRLCVDPVPSVPSAFSPVPSASSSVSSSVPSASSSSQFTPLINLWIGFDRIAITRPPARPDAATTPNSVGSDMLP